MKKTLILSLCLSAAILTTYLLAGSKSSLEGMAKANVEALASVPEEATCIGGGPGSNSCTIHWTVGPAEYECSVTCVDGYYSCCNVASCRCIKY